MANQTTASLMFKIQALLNKADSTEFAPEAAAFRGKAEELMQRYRIAEEELIATDPTSATPIMHSLLVCDIASPFHNIYARLLTNAALHAGVRYAIRYENSQWWADLVGYDADLRLAEWIYTTARLAFRNKLEPVIDPQLSDMVNVYNLRQAGMLRRDIAELMWGENTSVLRSKAQRLYVKECQARGESPVVEGGVNAKDYREAYARTFQEEFSYRLRTARDAADSTLGVIVLHGRSGRVDEAFYQFFPDRRPQPVPDVQETVSTPAKKGKEPKPYKVTQADMRRYNRMFRSPAAQAGGAAGRSAAREVEIDRAAQAHRLED